MTQIQTRLFLLIKRQFSVKNTKIDQIQVLRRRRKLLKRVKSSFFGNRGKPDAKSTKITRNPQMKSN